MPRLDIKSWILDERGSSLTMTAIGMVMALGICALAIDMGNAYVLQNKLQSSADSAALAAAGELPDENEAIYQATQYAVKNLDPSVHGTALDPAEIVPGNWNRTGRTFTAAGTPVNAVQLTVRRSQANGNPLRTFFGSILGISEVDISASAIAGPSSDPVCLLALEPGPESGINVGNGDISLSGCGAQSNSTAADSIDGNANGSITAETICSSGGVHANIDPNLDPPADTSCPAITDPLADLQPPTFDSGVCDHDGQSYNSDDTASPGTYCNGLSVGGSTVLTLNSGIYVINGGVLSVAGGASLIGTAGVSFYLTGGATVAIGGGGTVDLQPTVSGELAGVLFMQDRNDPLATFSFSGGAAINYAGIMYFLNGDVQFNGNGEVQTLTPATYFVANSFTFSGNGTSLTMSNDPDAATFPVPCDLSGVCLALLD